MRFFSCSEIKFLESCAVKKDTTYTDLMENAGTSVADFIRNLTDVKGKRIVIICGKGNNGGDGFVCARKLREYGAIISVILLQGLSKTELAKEAFDKLDDDINIVKNNMEFLYTKDLIMTADIVVDAIFGFGFKGKVMPNEEKIILCANSSQAIKVAIDLPSGANCDDGKVLGACFKADYTVTFTALKPANLLSPACEFCGNVKLVNVGVNTNYYNFLPESLSVIEEKNISQYFKPRDKNSHKGTYGRLLMICGSYGMIGAAIMAAKAALRSGVGLLNLVVDAKCYPLIASAVPEAIFTIMDFSTKESSQKSIEDLLDAIHKSTASVIGSGLGGESSRYMETLLKFSHSPIVIDADGLNFLSKNMDLIKEKNSDVIITPHPAEMARLMDMTTSEIQADRLALTRKFSKENNLHTILKGHSTIVSTPDQIAYINLTGNPGMATGGSGDVLSGIIGSLLAQGFTPTSACISAVYIHGKAGDLASDLLSQISMLPTDLINFLPNVFKKISKQ